MLSASPFILPVYPFRAAQSAARAEFRLSYFKNTPPVNFAIIKYCTSQLQITYTNYKSMFDFQNLDVYKKAKDLNKEILKFLKENK